MIATIAILTSMSFINHAGAQTPTSPQSFAASSAYITGASGRDYITPFAGFGVSMIPDSCYAYVNIASDTTKITYLLSTQIKQMFEAYNSTSCNIQTTLTPACTSYLDTINNLTLTYASYQAEGLKRASDKTMTCNADNTRKDGVYNRTYYGIDVVAITYASVRDAYVNNKFNDYTTLLNNVNKNLSSKLNTAIAANKFTDTTSSAFVPLRTLAQSTFKTTNRVVIPRARTVPPTPSTVLSTPNAFLLFGLTNNMTDKAIGAIPMNSLQEYAIAFKANPTRFGDIYSATNRTSLDAGEAILMNINKQIDLRLPNNLNQPVAVATTTNTQTPPVTQKASVINSIGNWFGDVWSVVSDFFGYMFWGNDAGAATGAVKASGTGASGNGASGTGASGTGSNENGTSSTGPSGAPKSDDPCVEAILKSISSLSDLVKALDDSLNDPEVQALFKKYPPASRLAPDLIDVVIAHKDEFKAAIVKIKMRKVCPKKDGANDKNSQLIEQKRINGELNKVNNKNKK
jgi:hypothetical protein